MKRFDKMVWAVVLAIVAMSCNLAVGQVKTPPVNPPPVQPGAKPPIVTQNGVFQTGIQQIPWFTPQQVQQQMQLKNSQFDQLNKAYQQTWVQYNNGVTGLDKNLTPEQRQQRMAELELKFYKDLGTSANTFITDPQQLQRYNQLYWQYRGYGAFEDPTIVEKLKLTPEQRKQFAQYRQDWNTQMNKIGSVYGTDQQQAIQQFNQLQTTTGQQLNTVLTPEQQKTWQGMIGNPYSFQPNVYFPQTVAPPAPGGGK